MPLTSVLGLTPWKLPGVTPVCDRTLWGEWTRVKDPSGPEGTAGQSRSMAGVIPSGAWPGDRHYSTACPILSPQGRGWGLITPSPNPPGGRSRVLQPTETCLVSALSLYLFLPALLCSQHSLRLNFWPQNPHSASKQQDPMGQPWRWRLAVSWPRHREAGPQSGCLHGCAWPQISHRKAKKHSPVFLPAPMSPARPPHSVGPLSLLDGAVM